MKPTLLSDLETDLGSGAACALVSTFGGRTVSIPKCATGSFIETALGADIASWLVAKHGAESIDIPGNASLVAAARRDHVAAHPEKSANVLAAEIGVTSRTIRKIRSALRRASDPPNIQKAKQ